MKTVVIIDVEKRARWWSQRMTFGDGNGGGGMQMNEQGEQAVNGSG